MPQSPDDTSNLRKPSHVPFDETWIEGKSNEELADLILQLVQQLKARVARETEKIAPGPASEYFGAGPSAAVKEFVQLPVVSMKTPDEIAATTWRIVLVGPAPDHKALGVEIRDDVSIGRWSKGVRPQLDLTEYGGENLGVSRRHAMLRPTAEALQLIDLGSTNGTQCNGISLGAGTPKAMSDGDIITFGGLHFMLKIVSAPGQERGAQSGGKRP